MHLSEWLYLMAPVPLAGLLLWRWADARNVKPANLLLYAAVLFALVTLPVEYDASNRARLMLKSTGLVSAREYEGASAVLSAAALTYVAALLQAVAQLFFFLLLVLGMRR